MQSVVRALRSDFTAAISSDQNDVTLDPSIARLRARLNDPAFLEPFSIFAKSQLREMNEALSQISNAQLKDDPMLVALAVDAVLKLFDRLEVTIGQGTQSRARTEAGRVNQPAPEEGSDARGNGNERSG